MVTIRSSKKGVKVRGEIVDINPQTFFNRITCVLNNSEVMGGGVVCVWGGGGAMWGVCVCGGGCCVGGGGGIHNEHPHKI